MIILLAIISYDIWFYISHLILHDRAAYFIHSLHHTKENPQFLDTYIGHWAEGPFQSLGVLAPFSFCSFSLADISIIILLLNLRGMMRHDSRFTFLIGNHHLLHHKYPRYNFGEYWLDSLFGTRYPNEAEYRYGLIYI